LKLVANTHDTVDTVLSPHIQQFSFDDFPEWKGLVNPELLVQRVQTSPLCYMHAPAVVQFYAVQRFYNASSSLFHLRDEHRMLDLTEFVRNHFSPKELFAYLFSNHGGNSCAFLRRILIPDINRIIPCDPEFALSFFEQYGAFLVSNFSVRRHFRNGTALRYTGRLPPDTVVGPNAILGNHAMVGLAVRKDADNHLFFLLQNWWTRQFVEVDIEYMVACEAVLYFVAFPQPCIPTRFATLTGRYFETEMGDGEEGIGQEMILST
jgi:hypothetical protein